MHLFRGFESLVLAAKTTGGEVGDINHSREFPPRVVDMAFEIMAEKLAEYLFSSPVGGFAPFFSIILDKDQCHLR